MWSEIRYTHRPADRHNRNNDNTLNINRTQARAQAYACANSGMNDETDFILILIVFFFSRFGYGFIQWYSSFCVSWCAFEKYSAAASSERVREKKLHLDATTIIRPRESVAQHSCNISCDKTRETKTTNKHRLTDSRSECCASLPFNTIFTLSPNVSVCGFKSGTTTSSAATQRTHSTRSECFSEISPIQRFDYESAFDSSFRMNHTERFVEVSQTTRNEANLYIKKVLIGLNVQQQPQHNNLKEAEKRQRYRNQNECAERHKGNRMNRKQARATPNQTRTEWMKPKRKGIKKKIDVFRF